MGQVFFRMIASLARGADRRAGAMASRRCLRHRRAHQPRRADPQFYLTSILFVLVVLGAIAWLSGFSILRFIAYIRDEL